MNASRLAWIALTATLLTGGSGAASADVLRGRVVGIVDGDTVTILAESREQVSIRLLGIDAPKGPQAFAPAAKARLGAIAYDREVNVLWSRRDGRGRPVGKMVMLDNAQCQGPGCPGVDAGLEQIRSGMAWWDRLVAGEQTPDDRAAYEQAEFQAKIRRIGLWNDRNPVPPRQFRHGSDD